MAALGGRMETVGRFLKSLWTRGNAPILAVMLLLTGYLCIILSAIYVSQIGLLESRLKQEEDEFQRVAMATGYYFEERKDDLVNLASAREVAVFFENKALGMSMEYGLGLSAIPIVHRFEDLIERKHVGQDTLFSRIVLLDSKANLIADSAPPQTTRKTTKQQWMKFISPKLKNGAILLSGGGKEILASTAYYFKEEYAGQIVAWLKPEAIYHFLLQDRQKYNSRYYLLADGGTSHLAVESIASVPPELQNLKFIEEGKPQIHPVTDAEGRKADFIVFGVPVADTPFSLVHVRPVKDVLGIMKPWQMLAGMGLLAALIVALIVYLLKINIRSLVLQTQLGMSEMREKEIQEKNIELENQIAERIKAEAKFRTIFENAPTGICLFDVSGRLTQVNKEWVNLFGAEDAAQLRGMNLLEEPFLLKDGLDALLQGNSIRREIAIDLEKEGFTGKSRKDHDTMLFLDILVTPLAAEAEAESKKYLVHAVDVTAKIRWEEKIREEEKEKLNEMELLAVSVMSSIPHAVFGLQNGTILFVNNAVESLFGWKPAELIGKDMGLLYRNDREYHDIGSMMYGALEHQKTCSYELEFPCRHKDGRDVLCRVNGARFGDVLKDRKVVVTYEDIADKKKAYLQLLQSEKMASIGQLAAGVAHEINNPTAFVSSNLKSLSGYIEDIVAVLEQYRGLSDALRGGNGSVNGQIAERLHRIESLEKDKDIQFILSDVMSLISESSEGAGRISRIVQDLKNFAHPGDERLKPVDLNKNIESTLNVVWNEIKYKAIVYKDYGKLPDILCYPQQLNQVFMNILVNAAHAISDKGEIRIATLTSNGNVEIRISDTGSGIPRENIPKLFDPFFTTKEVGKGTGLGLNVAYDIIKKHHGVIDVESTVGRGTTFTIRLPLSQDLH